MIRRPTAHLIVLGLVAGATHGNATTAMAAEPARATAAAHPTPPPMTKAEIDAFLSQPLVARIATVRKNGTPQVVPMWFLWEHGVMYMSTRTWAAKVKHIRQNRHVAVAIDVMEAPLKNKAVLLDGTAEIVTSGVKEMTTAIYQKYMGADAAKSPRAQENITTPRVLIKITPTTVHSMDTTQH
jgi:PPOX class probable F420-dependent enzyme